MAELLSPEPIENSESAFESRFGDEAAILEQLSSGEVEVKGAIDVLYPEIIEKHRNLVDLAEVDLSPQVGAQRNKNETVEVNSPGHEPILAVFKPLSGENNAIKNDIGGDFYPREHLAYVVSRHFYFDLVPPTVIREVNGDIGSLQLFMMPPTYLPARKTVDGFTETDYDQVINSADIRKLLLLDHLLANNDRHEDNYLYKVGQNRQLLIEDNQPSMIALDHGSTLNERYYQTSKIFHDIHGPYQFLTFDNLEQKVRNVPIEPEWLNLLRHGLEFRGLIDGYLKNLPGIKNDEIEALWRRGEELVKQQIYLSPNNLSAARQKSG